MEIWFSFCDPNLPRGSQFIGVVITKADSIEEAYTKINSLGINPGGEVMIYQTENTDVELFDKLLSRDELQKVDYI